MAGFYAQSKDKQSAIGIFEPSNQLLRLHICYNKYIHENFCVCSQQQSKLNQ